MKRIVLTQEKSALVDDEDFEALSQWNWIAVKIGKTYYATRSIEPRYLHRVLMKPAKRMCVDHIDGDGLNNQKSNLRVVSHSANLSNRVFKNTNNKSGTNGLSWAKERGMWHARLIREGKKHFLGYFKRKEDAEKAIHSFNKKLT